MKCLTGIICLAALNICAAANDVPANVSCLVSNTVVKAVPRMKSEEKMVRPQCEAVTKSGKRCSRKAAPGEKMCRQHLKAIRREAK